MVTAVFQGFYDVEIATKITGYSNRSSAKGFTRGCLWPLFSGTEVKLVGGFFHVTGGFCDIVSLDPASPSGPGIMTLTDWGDITPSPGPGQMAPGCFIIGNSGNVYGMAYFKQSGSPDTVIQHYTYPVTLGVNSTLPALTPTTIVTGNFSVPAHIQTGYIFMQELGLIATFYTGNEVDSNEVVTAITGLPASIYMAAPGTNYILEGNAGQLGVLDLSIPSFAEISVTWDNVDINTILSNNPGGVGLAVNSTVTPLGWMTFCLGTVTISSRTLTNFLVITSYDCSMYWVVNLIPTDANAVIAQGGVTGADRTGHITPGTLWFRSVNNGAVTGMVFAGPFAYPPFAGNRRLLAELGPVRL